jgi:hypothetical protein
MNQPDFSCLIVKLRVFVLMCGHSSIDVSFPQGRRRRLLKEEVRISRRATKLFIFLESSRKRPLSRLPPLPPASSGIFAYSITGTKLVCAILFSNRNTSIPADYSRVYFSISKTEYQYLETRATPIYSFRRPHLWNVNFQLTAVLATSAARMRNYAGLKQTPSGSTHKASI